MSAVLKSAIYASCPAPFEDRAAPETRLAFGPQALFHPFFKYIGEKRDQLRSLLPVKPVIAPGSEGE